jgi:DASS family divalent anion:Na+ symporter
MTKKQIIGLVVGALIMISISFIPAPEGLEPVAMRFLGIFIGFLVWMVMGVAPDFVVVLLAIAILLITKTVDFKTAFAPFGQTTTWLIIAGFGMAAALTKCGLLKRIALFIVQFFPENYRGQIMSMFAAGLVVSPVLPSVNAKAVLMAPIAASVSKELGFEKGSKGAAGLFSATYMSSGLFGNAFLTGSLYIFIMLGVVPEAQRGSWDFLHVLSISWIWLIVLVVLSFIAVLFLFKPDKELEMTPNFAKNSLKALGPMSKEEKWSALFLVLAVIAWMTESFHGVDAAVVAITALVGMTIFGGFGSGDFGPKIPWTTVILVGGILAIASMLTLFKIDVWLGVVLGPILTPLVGNVFVLIPVVVILVYLLRYVVISQIATGTIVIAIFGSLAALVGLDPFLLAFAVFTATQVWNLPFHNTAEIAARAATGGEMIEHKDIVKSSYAYMVINLAALMVSIPLWIALGLA